MIECSRDGRGFFMPCRRIDWKIQKGEANEFFSGAIAKWKKIAINICYEII